MFVTLFVLQVDDINGDKNVSSAQIIGECVSESFIVSPGPWHSTHGSYLLLKNV